MPRKRLSRKELTQKDEITSTLERVTEYAVDHSGLLLGIVGIVAVAAIAFFGWSAYSSRQEAASQSALSAVIRIYNDTAAYASDEERFLAAATEAEQVRTSYPGSPAAQIAAYYAALSYEGMGDLEQAEEELQTLIASGNESVVQIARYALAEAYKKRGDLEEAIVVFEALAETGQFEGAVLIELGKLHEALSRLGDARGYYETVLSEFPNSPFRVDADRALKRLGEAERATEEAES